MHIYLPFLYFSYRFICFVQLLVLEHVAQNR